MTPKGKERKKSSTKLDHVSPGRPTYLPTDPKKLHDSIDFAVTINIPI